MKQGRSFSISEGLSCSRQQTEHVQVVNSAEYAMQINTPLTKARNVLTWIVAFTYWMKLRRRVASRKCRQQQRSNTVECATRPHARCFNASIHSLFPLVRSEAETLERYEKEATHVQVSKTARHAVAFVVLRSVHRRRLNLAQLDQLRDDQLPHTTRILNTRVIAVTRHTKVQKESEL